MVRLLTEGQLAEALCVPRRAVQYLRQTHGLPCVKLGRMVRYQGAAVGAWFEAGSNRRAVNRCRLFLAQVPGALTEEDA